MWKKVNGYLLWLTMFALPWQMRKVLVPVFQRGDFVEYASLTLYLTDILIILLLITWLPTILAKRKLSLGPKLVTIPLAGLVVWSWLSLAWAAQLGLDLGVSVWAALHFLLFFGLYLYLINNVTSIRQILWPLGWGIGLQGALALGQYFSNHSLGLTWLDESVLDPQESGIPVVFVEGERQLRAHGLLPHANLLGGYLAVGLALIMPWLFSVKRRWPHYLMWVMFYLGLAGLIVSLSRAAWLAVAVSALVLVAWSVFVRPKKFRAAVVPGLVAIVIAGGLIVGQFSAIAPRFNLEEPVEQISIDSRMRQWREFKSIYSRHSVLGVGIGQYVPYMRKINESNLGWFYSPEIGGWQYSVAQRGRDYEPVHNLWLMVLAELGWLGLGLLLVSILGALYLLLRLIVGSKSLLAMATFVALLSVLILGLIDHYLWTLQQGRLLWWLVLAVATVLFIHSGYNKKYGRRKKR